MPINSNHPHRRSIRLQGYDYSLAGAYFITLVAWGREALFGEVNHREAVLNEIGVIVCQEWLRTEEIRHPEVSLDAFILMPNHLHGIIMIHAEAARGSPQHNPNEYPPRGPKPKSLGAITAGFKSAVTKRINHHRGLPGHPVWQRNYHDRIIRNEDELNRTREYILGNPLLWEEDAENPANQ